MVPPYGKKCKVYANVVLSIPTIFLICQDGLCGIYCIDTRGILIYIYLANVIIYEGGFWYG
jgi:hypothetical protein